MHNNIKKISTFAPHSITHSEYYISKTIDHVLNNLAPCYTPVPVKSVIGSHLFANVTTFRTVLYGVYFLFFLHDY